MSEVVETGNEQMVGVNADQVMVLNPKSRMTREQAIRHAAWLVSMSDCCISSADKPPAKDLFLVTLEEIESL